MRARAIAAGVALAVGATACAMVGDPAPTGIAAGSDPVPLVIWSSDSLSPELVGALGRAPGIEEAAAVATGTVDLRSVAGATKELPPRRPGAILPVSVSAIDPGPLALTATFREAAAALAADRAVLSATAAAMRGMEVGDRLRRDGNDRRVRLEVGHVLRQDYELNAEVLVPARHGAALGLRPRRALVLAVSPGGISDAVPAIERNLRGLPFRIRPLAGPAPEGAMRLLSLAEIKRIFGEFTFRPLQGLRIQIDPAWVRRNIAEEVLPGLGTVKCHRKILPQLAGATAELASRGLLGSIESYDGCWAPRMMTTNSAAVSRHAFGIAFDVNARANGLGEQPTMDRRVVEVFERWGFAWGGRFLEPDGMHFEFVRFPGDADG